jgi:hypothetical protein
MVWFPSIEWCCGIVSPADDLEHRDLGASKVWIREDLHAQLDDRQPIRVRAPHPAVDLAQVTDGFDAVLGLGFKRERLGVVGRTLRAQDESRSEDPRIEAIAARVDLPQARVVVAQR